jgi:hypothetical protein
MAHGSNVDRFAPGGNSFDQVGLLAGAPEPGLQ